MPLGAVAIPHQGRTALDLGRYDAAMSFWRRHLSALVRGTIVLLMVVALAPTVSRALAAADPVRALLLSEICSASRAETPDLSSLAMADAAGGVHCPACLAPVLGGLPPGPDRHADFPPPPRRPFLAEQPAVIPDGAGTRPPLPPRAPPRLA